LRRPTYSPPWSRKNSTSEVILMVDGRQVLKGIASSVAVAAATVTGGPAAGASLAAFLATPQGQQLLDLQVSTAAQAQGVALEDLARGGLITRPTLGLTGEAGPEMVIPMMGMPGMMKPKRKASTYNRKYAAAYRRIRKKKTLKSGKMAKGFGGKTGHKKIVKMAHAEVKKSMNGRKKR
jgi:hypothetical protein